MTKIFDLSTPMVDTINKVVVNSVTIDFIRKSIHIGLYYQNNDEIVKIETIKLTGNEYDTIMSNSLSIENSGSLEEVIGKVLKAELSKLYQLI